ncbi:unnamed protein product, partial [Brenthis ino]
MSGLETASACFHAEWIKLLIKDCEQEAEEFGAIKLLPPKGRAILWNLCSVLGFPSYGIPGQACVIFERYLYTIFTGYTTITDPRLQAELLKRSQKRCIVMMTGCILLAAKMNSSQSIQINANVVRLCLLCKEFQIPIWSVVDIALFLASEMNITVEKMRGIATIVDISEFYKVDIEIDLRKNTQLPLQFRRNGNIIRSLHLAAGAVAASSRLSNAPDSSDILTYLVKIPKIYIQCLCDAIVKQINSNRQRHQPLILKRKSSS